jgi:lipase maturation factor
MGPMRYELTRFVFLRLLGLIYFVAFLNTVNQALPLLGKHGLEPASLFLQRVLENFDGLGDAFRHLPTLFWWSSSDTTIALFSWLGLIGAGLLLMGVTNAFLQLFLWAVYLSIVHIGQTFYGFGWETMTLETGFLSIFLCPLFGVRPFPKDVPAPTVVFWLLRWELFRVMFGAGLIKIRGDACWRDLTCLNYHFETQPIPNPLSWLFHQLPEWALKGGVLWNHLAELVAPWFLFTPRKIRVWAALVIVFFQVVLIVSGNLSWLNWLTVTIAVACFDDGHIGRLFPRKMRDTIRASTETMRLSRARVGVLAALCLLVGVMSIQPTLNLCSSYQAMNASYDPLHLVNTYGAFGSVGEERDEVIVEGTADSTLTDQTDWKEYEFRCKPGDVFRRPCVVAPYHLRLDWLMWFAAMSSPRHHPWFLHFVERLLEGDRAVLGLLAANPFPEGPPKFVRATLYRYEFTRFGEGTQAWWRRTLLGQYLPPVSLSDFKASTESPEEEEP